MITKRQLFGTLLLFVGMLGLFTACGESGDDEQKKEAGSANLRVTPGSLKFGASGGKQSLSVSTIYDYLGAETSADWLDADFNDALSTLYVTASANPTDAVRNATLTIMGSNDGETIAERVTIKVEQEAGEGDTGTVFTVGPNGGKVELGDLTIDFPAGTFNGTTKVTVSEADMDELKGNANLSKYYKVNFYDGVRKDFKVSVKKNNSAIDDKNVKMQFVTQGFAESLNVEGLASIIRDVTNDNGMYVADIPAMESPDDNKESEVYFGLTAYYPLEESTAQTRASGDDFFIYWYPPFAIIETAENIDIEGWKKKSSHIVKDMEILAAQALEKIKSLGFEKPEGRIAIHIDSPWDYVLGTKKKIGTYGCHMSSIWGKKFGTVYISSERLDSYNRIEMGTTLIHEFLHHYQQFYDPRWTSGGLNMATVLDEATSVWIEQFMTNEFSRWGPQNVQRFIPCINPENEDIHDVLDIEGDNLWKDRYQDTGYGMSVLIEYLSQKFGNEVAVDILKERKKMKKSSEAYNTIQFIETVAKTNHKLDIFSQKGYKDFVEACGSKKVIPGISSFEGLLHKRKVNGDIGVVEKELEADEIVSLTNYAHGYGALVECLYTNREKVKSINDKIGGLENTKTTIEQTTEGLTTWVYYVGDENILIGQTKKGSPLDVSEIFYEEPSGWKQHQCYLVTIKDDFKDETKVLSNIEAKIEQAPKYSKIGIVLDYSDEEGDLRTLMTPDGTDDQSFWNKKYICELPVDFTMNEDNTIATITGYGKLPWCYRNPSVYYGVQYCEVKIELEVEPVDVVAYAIHKLKGSVTWNGNVEDDWYGDPRKVEKSATYNFDVECYKMQADSNTIKYFASGTTASEGITDLSEKVNIIYKEKPDKNSTKTYRMGSKYSPTLTIYLNLDSSTMK